MYKARRTREVKKEDGRILTYYSVEKKRTGAFIGCMVRVVSPQEEGQTPIEHWFVDSEMDSNEGVPCSTASECFVRVLKACKRRGGKVK